MFSKFHSVALLAAILPTLASAGVVSQRASDPLICGKKGDDGGNGNYYYSQGKKINTYTACSAKCAGDTNCSSFGIGEACMLFNIPMTGNFEVNNDSRDTYYDKACLSSPTTTTTSTTSTPSSPVKTTMPTSSSTVTLSTSAPTTSTTTSSKTTSSTVTSSSTSAPTTSTITSSKTTTSTVIKVTTSSSSTSQASTTTNASSTTTSASSTVTVPSGCPAPTAVTLTGLSWFNSTHNLDCPSPNYPPNSQVCWDDKHICVDEADGVPGGPRVCACTPFCYTGLPQVAYSPFGYGPPDNITINLDDRAQPSCTAVMPTGFRDFEIGSGHVNCGSAADTLEFYGDSNKDSGNNGSVYYTGFVYNSYSACNGTPRYGGSFPLSCTRDAGGNATCGLAHGSVTLTLLSLA